MKINSSFSKHQNFKLLYAIALSTLTVLVFIFFQSCGLAGETKMERSNSINQTKAIEIANHFVREHYANDSYLKDKTNPSSVTNKGDIWVVFYEDKVLARLPSGLELAIDKKTGKIWRRNQE